MSVCAVIQDESDVLHQICTPVVEFDVQLAQWVSDLSDTMVAGPSLSLSAPQIGILRRVFVMDVGQGLQVFVNPVLTDAKEEQEATEWCASFPNQPLLRRRPLHVTVQAQDPQGQWFVICATGLAARLVCHELDHLEGKVFYDDLPDENFFQQFTLPWLDDEEDSPAMEEQQEFLDLARDALWKLTLWLNVLNEEVSMLATKPAIIEIQSMVEHLQELVDEWETHSREITE